MQPFVGRVPDPQPTPSSALSLVKPLVFQGERPDALAVEDPVTASGWHEPEPEPACPTCALARFSFRLLASDFRFLVMVQYSKNMQLVLPDIKEPRTLGIEPDPLMDDDRYFDFCQQNPKLRIERTSEGKIVIMPPVGLESQDQEFQIGVQLGIWAAKDGRGRAYGPTLEFMLPNRAGRAPDASWVSYSQLKKLTQDQRSRFPHLCPEFIIEVKSPSDRVKVLKARMREWIENGVQLAWLIDSRSRTVTIYRPDREPEDLVDPDVVVGEGPVKGFRLRMSKVWDGW